MTLDDNEYEPICDRCGKPMQSGFTTEGGLFIHGDHFCEDCFESAMDEMYGKGGWRVSESEECGENGGYYDELVDGQWIDTGFYYTEWY